MKFLLIAYIMVYADSVPYRTEQEFKTMEDCVEAQKALFYPSATRYPPWWDHAWSIQSSCQRIK